VKVPATLLVVVGAIHVVMSLASPLTKPWIMNAILQIIDNMHLPPEARAAFTGQNVGFGVADIFGMVFGLAIGGLTITGGLKMMKLQSWGLALTAAILAVIPCNSCCCISLIPGIWALIVLSKQKPFFT
jgi:hypothetical protein